jgi:predicted DNA-binding transcriptional regulator AlpA
MSAEKLLERQAEADARQAAPGPTLLKAEAVAAMLSIGGRTLWRWISEGAFPKPDFRRNERVVRWKRSTVEQWIETNATAAA